MKCRLIKDVKFRIKGKLILCDYFDAIKHKPKFKIGQWIEWHSYDHDGYPQDNLAQIIKIRTIKAESGIDDFIYDTIDGSAYEGEATLFKPKTKIS